MLKKSARKLLLLFLVSCFLFLVNTESVLGQVDTPTPTLPAATSTPTVSPTPAGIIQPQAGEPKWQVDAEVTQVGKNAERARQLIYWVVKHPLLVNVPVVAQVWASVRNVAYGLSLLVIIGLALHLVISRRGIGPTFTGISLGLEKLTLLNIVVRIIAILLFITLSYSIMRLMIEGSEVTSRFFIERLGGEDLFNIVFAGGNVEDNYTDFVGYKNADPLEQEMANTSLLLVRLTSFTYNFISVILILRQIILLFLLIISPILVILMPFIFIRNTGFIWIGEFFRWLFYGPLFALFISALARIWKAGIPYAFNFDRAESGEIVYPTAINILYGGPGQVGDNPLSPTNTANYIDTYAEYVIALIMLWAAIILPWILLRIFRDYCCDILRENQNALLQILDKMRNLGRPPSPPPVKPEPTTAAGRAFDLPFRQQIFEQKTFEKEKVIEKIRERDVENVSTRDLVRAVNLEVKSLRDIARSETNKQFSSTIQSALKNIQSPASTSTFEERRDYSTLRDALIKRAAAGDKEARKVIQALTPKVSETPHIISQIPSETLKEAVAKPGMPVVIPQIARIPTAKMAPVVSPQVLSSVSQKTQVPQDKIEKILKHLPTITGTEDEKNKKLAQKAEISEEQVKEVLKHLPEEVKKEQEEKAPAPAPTVTVEDYEEVKTMWLNHYRKSEVPKSEKIKNRVQWLEEDVKMLTNTINLLTSASVKDRQKGMEEVANLLPFLLLGGFGDLETLTYIKAKLEAAKQAQIELEQIYKAKEEEKEKREKVKIPLEEEKEEEKTMQAEAQKEMPLPEEEEKKVNTENSINGKNELT